MLGKPFFLMMLFMLAIACSDSAVEYPDSTQQYDIESTVAPTHKPEIPPSTNADVEPLKADLSKAREYKLALVEDMSHKALTGPLSSYSAAELRDLPIDKKISYKIIVPQDIRNDEVEPTIRKVINDLSNSDKDVDEVMLFLYSDPEIINGAYDIASAVWAPKGKLGNVTPEIASSNDRGSYQLSMNIKSNIEEYLAQRQMSGKKFGYDLEARKKIYRELIDAERRAQDDADKAFPLMGIPTSQVRINLDKNVEFMRKLKDQYENHLQDKLSLTEEQLQEIAVEGLTMNWPME